MNNDITPKQLAIEWWCRAIQRVKYDNGDSSHSGGIAMALATMARKPPTESQLIQFAEELSRIIPDDGYRTTSCDYGPDHILSAAARVAGIDQSAFPWKTVVIIHGDGIDVGYGYRAPLVKLKKMIDVEKFFGE